MNKIILLLLLIFPFILVAQGEKAPSRIEFAKAKKAFDYTTIPMGTHGAAMLYPVADAY